MSNITIFSGETFSLSIEPIKDDGTVYTLEAGDRVIFSVAKWACSHATPVLQRTLTMADYSESTLILTISPEETSALVPGLYKYDCGLQTSSGDFFVFIPPADFVVKPSISRKAVEET